MFWGSDSKRPVFRAMIIWFLLIYSWHKNNKNFRVKERDHGINEIKETNLNGGDFEGANFRETNLEGANLSGNHFLLFG